MRSRKEVLVRKRTYRSQRWCEILLGLGIPTSWPPNVHLSTVEAIFDAPNKEEGDSDTHTLHVVLGNRTCVSLLVTLRVNLDLSISAQISAGDKG